MIDCIHAAATDRPSLVECGLGLHGGRPHAGLCGRCARREPHAAAVPGPRAEGRLSGSGRATNNRARPALQGRARQLGAVMQQRRTSGRRSGLIWSEVEPHLLLRNFLSPGDVLMLTAAVRDLHRAYPGRFTTAVQTACPGLWQNNPYVTPVELLGRTHRSIECQYPLIHQSNQRPFHFIHGYTQDLEAQLGLRIPVTDFRGDVYMSAEEKQLPSPAAEAGHSGPYWVIMAGGKYDFTAKWWSPDSYQAVVEHFRGKIRFVQCGEADHWHTPLEGVVNLIGKTSHVRRFIRLIYHADGVLCPVTFAMHLSAAVDLRPGQTARGCVVIAGGREPTHWEMYPGHQFLHTQGALNCCAGGGCWKSRCQPVDDGDEKNSDLCVAPVEVGPDLRIPK